MITDDCGGTCTDARRSLCMDTQTHGSTSKDSRGNAYTDDCGSTCTDVSTDITGVHGIMCQYTYTKGTGVQGVTSMDDSTVNTSVRDITNTYGEYIICEPIRDIGMYVVGKIQKGISYDDALQQVS